MLRLLRLPVEIARMIDTAEAERMRKLSESWDAEIAEFAERHKRSEQKIREALDHQALNAADIERDLLGFISRAATGDDVVVSIPSSLQVAVVGGPSIDALQSIIAAAGGADDSARKGEAKYMPHPADMAALFDGVGIESVWSPFFHDLAGQMKDADSKSSSSLTRMKAEGGLLMFGALKDEKRLLEQLGPDRLMRLIANPASITKADLVPPARESAVWAAMQHVRSR